MLLNGAWTGQASMLVVLHGAPDVEKVTLPAVPGLAAYQLLWDSSDERPASPTAATLPGTVEIGPTCIRVYHAVDPT
jgi:glycogen operon protein